ncbi:hypothetical protein BC829DRAFT_124010 [Chytridium lagenaria]|nr:hypothetical protein BC829DRAFT_124010 [Chytridium lagenaria]
MSGFRNFNQPTKASNYDDDDDWRDSEPTPQKAPPATSVAERIASVGQRIPVSAQAPTPAVVSSSYNSYAANQDSGVEYPRKTSVTDLTSSFNRSGPATTGYQPPARPTYPYPTAATATYPYPTAATTTAAAPPKPLKLTPTAPSPAVESPSFANNPFLKTPTTSTPKPLPQPPLRPRPSKITLS